MATNWFVKHGGKAFGPISSSRLRQLAESRRIEPETQVRREQDADWTPASRVKGLFDPGPEKETNTASSPQRLTQTVATSRGAAHVQPQDQSPILIAPNPAPAQPLIRIVSPPVAQTPRQSDAVTMMQYDANKKSTIVAYLLWIFVGNFGAHRFYLGATGSGLFLLLWTLASIAGMFVLIGFLMIWVTIIWVLIDAFLIPGMVQRHNIELARRLS